LHRNNQRVTALIASKRETVSAAGLLFSGCESRLMATREEFSEPKQPHGTAVANIGSPAIGQLAKTHGADVKYIWMAPEHQAYSSEP
jgi:hypothetical protein